MPFQDLPCRREESAPILDLSDPREIWRYFDDLDFLFAKHRVSDPQEKKRAAVNYPSVAVERLWKTVRALGDPTRSYEDFKAEIIALYPEAIAAQEHTLADFDRLVTDRTRTPIGSEIELGAYYRDFLIISRFLIAKGRISVQMQARALLASFEPCLATAVHSRLERKFLDHFPDDPYETDDIYDAALYALVWQRAAPLIEPLREIPTLSTPAPTMPAPLQSPPPTFHALLPATEALSPAQSDPVTAMHALTWECAASPVPAPRDAPTTSTPTPAIAVPIPSPPPPAQAYPPALRFIQADMPAAIPTFVPQHPAPLVPVPRDVSPPSAPTLATPAPSQFPPPSNHAFPPVPESPQPAQTNPITVTLDALAEAIATLKTGLEAILSAQQSAESCAPESDAAQSRAEQCKFCRSAVHLEEECEEADKYILAGKCKRNVFGKIVLPSGAEVPWRIKGKCLRERFEEYHRQYPGQQAAPAYLEDLARLRRPAPQDAMGAMSLGTKATTPAMCEALRQPRSPERTLRDPRAASDQTRTPEVSGDPRKTKGRPSATLAVPRIITRPSSGQSGPEHYKAATRAPPRMRESNFAQQLSAAARFSVSPEACAMYSVQATTPQLARDPEREEAMPFKRPQVLATAVVARASAAPPETVQKAADPASVVPLSVHEVPASVHDTAGPSRKVRDTISVPVNILHSTRDTPRVPPSVRVSVPPGVPIPSRASASVRDPISVHASIRDLANPRSARVASRHVHETASARSQAGVPRAANNITRVAPASVCDTASPPRSVHDSCSAPSRVSASVPKSPSVRFSVPKRPQLASQSPHTPNAIRSRPRWPRSRPSCHASVHEGPQTLHPPRLSAPPFPRFTQPANPHNELRATQPNSDEQPANRRRATAPQLPFRPRKPPDTVRQACAMPARF